MKSIFKVSLFLLVLQSSAYNAVSAQNQPDSILLEDVNVHTGDELIFDPPISYVDPENPDIPNVSSNYSVGSSNGSFNVTESGAAEYSINVNCPDGGGLTPQIRLVYNSQNATYGPAGYGISVTGFSAITRGEKTLFNNNGNVQGVTYTASDNLFLDGKRLILQSGNQCQEGTTYCLEGDPYTLVTAHGTYDDSTADVWFEVKTPDGKTYHYGSSQFSRIEFKDTEGKNRIASWYVDRIEDVYKNYIQCYYIISDYYAYPSSIHYGMNSQQDRHLSNAIYFTYTNRFAEPYYFNIGGRRGQINNCISNIRTVSNGSTYREYNLTYDYNSDQSYCKYARLVSIQEKNGKGECLPPTQFNWNYLPSGNIHTTAISIPTTEGNTYVKEQSKTFYAADLNGDGVSDIIRISPVEVIQYSSGDYTQSKYETRVYISTSSISSNRKVSYSTPVIFEIPTSISLGDIVLSMGGSFLLDYDGDGLNDIIFPYYRPEDDKNYQEFRIIYGKDVVKRYGGIPSGFGISLNASSEAPLMVAFDTDKNGTDDIICIEKDALNGKYTSHIIKNKEITTSNYNKFYLSFPDKPQKLFCGDYNNDGLTDIIILYKGGYKIYFNNGGTEDDLKFTETNSRTGTNIFDNWRVKQGDFDGDGLIDFVYNVSGETCLWVARNNGDGTFSCTKSEDIGVSDGSTVKDDDKFAIMVYDIDRDGRSDVMLCKTGYKKNGFPQYKYVYTDTQIKWLFSNGNNLKLKNSFTISKREDDANEGHIFLGDFDGDGNMEVANYGSDLLKTTDTFIENTLNIYKIPSFYPETGRVSSFTDGLGNVETVSYAYTTDPSVYTRTSDENTYPVNTYTLPLSVVKKSSSTNGAAGIQQYEYSYKDFKIHVKGRGPHGFSEISKTNTTNGENTRTIIKEWDKNRWIPIKTEVITTVGEKISYVISSNTIESVGNTYFMYESVNTVTDIDGNTATTVSTYDTSKGVILEQTVSNDGENMYKKVVYSGYENKAGVWMPTSMKMIQKHADDPVPYSSETRYQYGNSGFLRRITTNYGTRQAKETVSRCDFYGNYTFSETRGEGMPIIKSAYEYDQTGRFVVKTYSNPASAVKTFTYDEWGNVLTENDESDSSNILTSTYTYDNWGRRISSLAPDGTKTTTELGWGTENNKKYYILTRTSGRPWVLTWYDSRGHEVEQRTFGPQNVGIVKYTTYNNNGLVSRTENLNGKLRIAKSFTYDALGRVQTEHLSTGKENSYSYGNRSVSVTSAGRTSTKTIDAWGNTVTSTDPADGTVSYVYKSNGKPSEITSNGTTVYMEYDSIGCVASVTDPDAGTVKSMYSAHGKLMSRIDAKGVETIYTYDKLGRVATVKIGEHLITNTYGESGNDYLRLKKQTMGDKTIEYFYDRYGRILHEKRTIPEEGVLNLYCTYNEQNRLSKTYYPGGLVVKYDYDDYGFRTATTAGGMPIFTLDEYRGPENYTLSFMDNITSIVKCDINGFPYTRQLVFGDSVLNQLEFKFDRLTGNLLSRTKDDSVVESFEYDNLDRLTTERWGLKVFGDLKPEKSRPSILNPKIEYAPNGNILYKPGVGNYTYDSSFKPHAVVAVDNKNGRIPSEALITAFNDFGKIQIIEDEGTGRITEFTYGPDMQRWSSRLTVNGNDSIKTVYFGNYEKITDNGHTREFYYLDGGVIVIKENGVFKPYIAFTDHLGSIMSVVDREGTEVFEAQYDAWGEQTVKRNAIGLRRGYTGHEMLGEYGIINMNGRLYDPVLGRFFSPDNYVQFPGFTQSYNRYSYCLNNPLKYTDPSGELSFTVAFGIFNVITGMMQAAFNGENVWKAGILGIMRAGAAYGIGDYFDITGSIGRELLRAGAHGITSGIFNSFDGGSFGNGFASGFVSSYMSSFLNNHNLKCLFSTVGSGFAAWAAGGNFLSGAMQGMIIHLYNFELHGDGPPGDYYDNEGELYVMLHPVECEKYLSNLAEIRDFLSVSSTLVSGVYYIGKSLEKFSENTTIGDNGMLYYAKIGDKSFRGNQHVNTKFTVPIGKQLAKRLGIAGNILGAVDIFSGGIQDYKIYKNEGYTDYYHTIHASGEFLGSMAGGWSGVEIGGYVGGCIGGLAGGVGAIPGALIGGAVGGFWGAWYGGDLGGNAVDYYYYK